MKIKIHKAKNKQYYFTLNARNGQVIVTSETYKTTAGLLKGVRALAGRVQYILGSELEYSATEQVKSLTNKTK